jgi:hypothetical protein
MRKNIWDYRTNATEKFVGKLSELIVENSKENLEAAFCEALYNMIGDNELFFMFNKNKDYLQIYADIGGHDNGKGIPLYDLKNEIDKCIDMMEAHRTHHLQKEDNDYAKQDLVKLVPILKNSLALVEAAIDRIDNDHIANPNKG